MDNDYAAAGILPFAVFNQDVCVLLPEEYNRGSYRCSFTRKPGGCRAGRLCEYLHIADENVQPEERENIRLNLLGGRREIERGEDVPTTAGREFSEETGGLIPVDEARHIVERSALVDGSNGSLYNSPIPLPGKYRLFLREIDGDRYRDVPTRYASMTWPRPRTAEAQRLIWVSLSDLLGAIRRDSASMGFHLVIRGQPHAITHLLYMALTLERHHLESMGRMVAISAATRRALTSAYSSPFGFGVVPYHQTATLLTSPYAGDHDQLLTQCTARRVATM
jgi:hypothetical protein